MAGFMDDAGGRQPGRGAVVLAKICITALLGKTLQACAFPWGSPLQLAFPCIWAADVAQGVAAAGLW